jgi:hypothetical protein
VNVPPVRHLLFSFLLIVGVASGGGCTAHRHTVGLGPTGTGETSVRQWYLLFGLAPVNEVDTQRLAPDLTSYAIETRSSFLDIVLLPLLLPFTVVTRTVTVRT